MERALQYKSLYHFIRGLWQQVETAPFKEGWHLRAICDHLEAVTSGAIRRLIINIPPRHMKSLAVSVFWPVWEWLHAPGTQFLYSSYAHSLSLRDSVRCRRILSSRPYLDLGRVFCPDFLLTGDQNTKERYDTNQGGSRLATSVGGALTGEGGDKIVVDDPHNVIEGESAAVREATLQWWDEAMSTRLNDPRRGAFVIIQQRVHDHDLTGHVLAGKNAADWSVLCLPARYEGQNRCRTALGFVDPRRTVGEPLWPEQYGDAELTRLERSLGPYAAAGQLQQRPAPREGGMFKVGKLRLAENIPASDLVARVRYWDKAATPGGGCRTAGVLMGRMKDSSYVVLDVVKGQWGPGEREAIILQTARLDGRAVDIWVEQEPGSGGLESAQCTIRNLSGFFAKADRPTGSKERRAEPFAAQVEIGNVTVLNRGWTRDWIEEHRGYPRGFMDQVDASAGAFSYVARAGGGAIAVA